MDIYNTSTGSWSTAALSKPRTWAGAASAGNDVAFGGGDISAGNGSDNVVGFSNVVDLYNTSSNVWSTATLSQSRASLAAAAAGNDVVFAGGYNGTYSNVVDILHLPNYTTISSSSAYTLWLATTVSGRMTLSSPGGLDLANFGLNVGSVSGNAPIDLGSGTLTAGSDNTNTTYAGNISDVGTLVKIGNRTLVLAGSNTYSGGTAIDAGTLMAGAVNTLPASSAVNVSGGLLDLTAGSQTIASLAMDSAGSLKFSISELASDELVLDGSGALNGTLDVVLHDGFVPEAGDTFELLDGSLSGAFSEVNLPALSNGLRWDTSNLDTNGSISVVPEPSTAVLACMGAIALVRLLPAADAECEKATRLIFETDLLLEVFRRRPKKRASPLRERALLFYITASSFRSNREQRRHDKV